MTLLVTYVAIALGVSFLCSILEATLLTLTPAGIQSAKAAGRPWAVRLEAMKEDVERPLAAILTLNTVAHTMGAAGAGAEYARVYGNGTEAIFAAALTVAVLILTEIIPKTLGARYAQALAPFAARILPVMIVALSPLVWFSQQLTRLITFGKGPVAPQHREELRAVADMGAESGQLQESETQFLRNLLDLDQVAVEDIMTPRPVIVSLPIDVTIADFVGRAAELPFSRIPVYRDDPDAIEGFVLRSEAFARHFRGDGDALVEIVRPIASVPPQLTIDRLFQRLIADRHHMMLVTDEYGSPMGIVTLEDVLETVFGFEIVDELDKVPDLQLYARDLWRDRARRIGIIEPDGAAGLAAAQPRG
jgi:CBS domain containing-hemolysin-like protein